MEKGIAAFEAYYSAQGLCATKDNSGEEELSQVVKALLKPLPVSFRKSHMPDISLPLSKKMSCACMHVSLPLSIHAHDTHNIHSADALGTIVQCAYGFPLQHRASVGQGSAETCGEQMKPSAPCRRLSSNLLVTLSDCRGPEVTESRITSTRGEPTPVTGAAAAAR